MKPGGRGLADPESPCYPLPWMGTADRDYFRDEQARYAGGGRPPMPPVSKFLFIANIAIFVIDWLLMDRALTGRPDVEHRHQAISQATREFFARYRFH